MTQHSSKLFVGIDAHQRTLAIAVLPEDAQEAEPVREIANEPARVRAFFRRLSQRGPIEAVYEAGCLGFVLHRLLTKMKIQCMVAAPSRIPVLPGDRRKTDRLDARRLAVFLRGRQLVEVTPPTPELEALRSLVRLRTASHRDMLRALNRLQKFLLHRGHIWRDGDNWTVKHMRWIREQRMALGEDQLTLDYLRMEVDLRKQSVKILDERIARRAEEVDVKLKVQALTAFRGVATLTALSTIAEIGDPKRFRNGAQVASYCGLIPSEHSSGERIRRGPITRSGSPNLRRLMVESAQHVQRPVGRSPTKEKIRARLPAPMNELARRADLRLHARYHRLSFRMPTNRAKTAVARELVGFLWKALMLCEPK